MTLARLHVAEEGRGDAVVLVHAIGCDMRMWDDVAPMLAERFRVIRVDVRGHGASPVPPRPYSLGQLAGDVAGALDRLGIERAHWVGLSMGAMIGQAFALDHPSRLGRLVLANTTSSYGADGRQMWEARAKAVDQGGMAAITELAMTRYFSDEFRARHGNVVERVRTRFLATNPQGYMGCCEAIRDLDFSNALAKVRASTLVIAGENDAGTPPAMSEAMAAKIPDARMEVIAHAAHLSAVERPAEFGTLVRDFLVAER